MASLPPTSNANSASNRIRNILLSVTLLVLFRVTVPAHVFFSCLSLLAVFIPFFGVLTRYRAYYAPRTTVIDAERVTPTTKSSEHVSPGGLIAITSRVVQHEGLTALWRGWVPVVAVTLATRFIDQVFPWHEVSGLLSDQNVSHRAFVGVCTILFAFVFFVAMTREATAPFAVDWWHPLSALSSLVPFPSFGLHALFIVLLSGGHLLLLAISDVVVTEIALAAGRDPIINQPNFDGTPPTLSFELLRAVAPYWFTGVAVEFILSVPVCALEVLIVRTATAHLARPAAQPINQPKHAVQLDEDSVTRLRNPAYPSPFGIPVAVWTEEGPRTLLRGWWVTLVLMVLGVYPTGFCWAVWA